jgi:hypothetical protein
MASARSDFRSFQLSVPGLTVSSLYDSSKNFKLEGIDPADFSPNSPDNHGVGDGDILICSRSQA